MNDKVEDLASRIARAHIHGDGNAVLEIWKRIAKREMPPEETIKWAELIADWICVSGPSTSAQASRAEKMHVSLTVSGWAEANLDTLEDEHLLFLCATEGNGLRSAAEAIWTRIAANKATQGLRDRWLDYIAGRLDNVIKAYKKREITPQRRPDKVLNAVALLGKQHEDDTNSVEMLYRTFSKFSAPDLAINDHQYVRNFIKRLVHLGVINKDSDTLARSIREMIRKHPPQQSIE